MSLVPEVMVAFEPLVDLEYVEWDEREPTGRACFQVAMPSKRWSREIVVEVDAGSRPDDVAVAARDRLHRDLPYYLQGR